MARVIQDAFVVEWPTLYVAADWMSSHLVVPKGEMRGAPWEHADWQLWCMLNHYRVKPKATVAEGRAPAFHNRRSQFIGPQKSGKSPLEGGQCLLEGVGPALFNGWAGKDDGYVCADHGCPCGWEYPYQPGEAMGRPWVTSLIQVTGLSEDATKNVFDPIREMVKLGPLSAIIDKIGQQFVRLPNSGLIEAVTSSAQSRLGNPVTFVVHDESGVYTESNGMREVAETQRRGAAGMGGRTVEITNPWDSAENSVAQRTWEGKAKDVFKYWPQAPVDLKYKNKKDRAIIHEYVYRGCNWVNLDGIEAEAAEIMETDPPQAERFFGCRVTAGAGSYEPDGLWAKTTDTKRAQTTGDKSFLKPVPAGSLVSIGFDGSDSDDWTAIRLVDLRTLRRFTPTYGPDNLPTIWDPRDWGGSIPRGEVDAAMDEICTRFAVKRGYFDPPDWRSEIGAWAMEQGEDVIIEWPTYRTIQMHAALSRNLTDLASGKSSHDACEITATHYGNARKIAQRGLRYLLGKKSPMQKIDACMADVLAYEAAMDAIEAGALTEDDSWDGGAGGYN